MAKKFKEGDLIALKESAVIRRYPDPNDPDWLTNEVIKRSPVSYVCDRRAGGGEFVQLEKGEVGLVKGYENVFLVEHDHFCINKDDDSEYSWENEKWKALPKEDKDRMLWGPWEKADKSWRGQNTKFRYGYLNREGAKCLLVLIDSRLVAFREPSKYFELGERAFDRHAHVKIEFHGSHELSLVTQKEVEAFKEKYLKWLRNTALDNAFAHTVTYTARDGTITVEEFTEKGVKK